LITSAGEDVSLTKGVPATTQVLDEGDVASIFGLEMAEPTVTTQTQVGAVETAKKGTSKKGKGPVSGNQSQASRTKSGTKPAIARAVTEKSARPARSA
jgi:hypothetical protein